VFSKPKAQGTAIKHERAREAYEKPAPIKNEKGPKGNSGVGRTEGRRGNKAVSCEL
jgi:hypothetical protein